MNPAIGLTATTHITLGVFLVSCVAFGFRPIVSEVVVTTDDVESARRNEGMNPGAGARAGCAMVMINGSPTGQLVASAAFNAIYPLLNVTLQADAVTWASLKTRGGTAGSFVRGGSSYAGQSKTTRDYGIASQHVVAASRYSSQSTSLHAAAVFDLQRGPSSQAGSQAAAGRRRRR